VQASGFDEIRMFRAIAESGVRALLIGRRAVIAFGIPVMTSDYDFWMPADDADALNAALRPLDLFPNRTTDEARQLGGYRLENDTNVDVLTARSVSTVDGTMVAFDDVWSRHIKAAIGDVSIAMPCLDDLILTKRFGNRPRDADDIRMLEMLRGRP
jgi:hypothetical protein